MVENTEYLTQITSEYDNVGGEILPGLKQDQPLLKMMLLQSITYNSYNDNQTHIYL